MQRLTTSLKNLAATQALLLALFALPRVARAGTNAWDFSPESVQAPVLAEPSAASIRGTLARTSYSATEMGDGAFGVPLPVELVVTRGAPLFNVIPSYSPGSGLTEWGLGWSNRLCIRRDAVVGDIDYGETEVVSPFGRLARGVEGRYYPSGMQEAVRFDYAEEDDTWSALHQDGREFVFDHRVEARRGTYAWCLTMVTAPNGAATELKYTYDKRDSRSYLQCVIYGGAGHERDHRLVIEYRTVREAVSDLRSGDASWLGRRVYGLRMETIASSCSGDCEEYALRWHYVVSHKETDGGPARFLTSVQRFMANGESFPAHSFEYDMLEDHLAEASYERVEQLDGFLSGFGASNLLPNRATWVDLDGDGDTDLEEGWTYTRFYQGDGTWGDAQRTEGSGRIEHRCRPGATFTGEPVARRIMRLAPNAPPHVLALQSHSPGLIRTEINVCDAQGRPLHASLVVGDFEPSPIARVVDLNRDGRPDLLSVQGARATAAINHLTYENDGTYSGGFEKVVLNMGAQLYNPQSAHVADVNGDGLADIIIEYDFSGYLAVHFGRGHLEFTAPESVGFISSSWFWVELDDYDISFIDVDRDGLTDALLTNRMSGSVSLYAGHQGWFGQMPFPHVRENASPPIVADLSGSGEAEIVHFWPSGDGTLSAYALQTSRPSTSLLVGMNDGMGTVIRFSYERTKAEPEARSRRVVVSSISKQAVGSGIVRQTLAHREPVLHSQAEQLIGYKYLTSNTMRNTSECESEPEVLLKEETRFHHSDDIKSLLIRSTSEDPLAQSSLISFFDAEYDESSYEGVSFQRMARVRRGFVASEEELNEEQLQRSHLTKTYDAYERGLCPTEYEVAGPGARVQVTVSLASTLAARDNTWHCLEDWRTLHGSHANDPALDFEVRHRYERNDVGLMETSYAGTPTGFGAWEEAMLVHVGYDDLYRPTSMSKPGRGTTWYEYVDYNGLLGQVTEPTGVVHRVGGFDALSSEAPRGYDALTDLLIEHETIRRGPSTETAGTYGRFFGYDNLERLNETWDSQTGTSSEQPLTEQSYQWAVSGPPGEPNEGELGVVLSSQLVTHPVDGAVKAIGAELQGSDGEARARLAQIPTGWAIEDLILDEPSKGLRTALWRAPLGVSEDGAVATPKVADVYSGAVTLATELSTGLGETERKESRLPANVTTETTSTTGVHQDFLVRTATVAGQYVTETHVDAWGRTRKVVNETLDDAVFTHDALGRLRYVKPLGHAQVAAQAHYDGQGRIESVSRDAIGGIVYTYYPGTPLQMTREFHRSDGTIDHQVYYTYDDAGRVLREDWTGPELSSATVSYDYDGLGDTPVADQVGHLSAVDGPYFRKTWLYRPDGKVAVASIEVGDFTVEEAYEYLLNGKSSAVTRSIWRSGVLLSEDVRRSTVDSVGRFDQLWVGSALAGEEAQLLYDSTYDDEGKLAYVTFSSGAIDPDLELGEGGLLDPIYTPLYDATTRQPYGYGQNTPGRSMTVDWQHNTRGLIDSETYTYAESSQVRRYKYDPRGFLETAIGPSPADHTYSSDGLLHSATDVYGSRTWTVGDGEVTFGRLAYRYDKLGRLIEQRTLETEETSASTLRFSYDARGNLSQAQRDGSDEHMWRYSYDETSQRIAKWRGQQLVAAYVFGGYLTTDGEFYEPVRVDGRLVGLLRGSVFIPLQLDPRGTVVGKQDGSSYFASPYGGRCDEQRDWSVLSAVVDYAEKGYDADIATVRSGVRDLGVHGLRWTTPDPYVLEHPEVCIENTTACNLYSYAGNDPVNRLARGHRPRQAPAR